jgi:hypothetical protein
VTRPHIFICAGYRIAQHLLMFRQAKGEMAHPG